MAREVPAPSGNRGGEPLESAWDWLLRHGMLFDGMSPDAIVDYLVERKGMDAAAALEYVAHRCA